MTVANALTVLRGVLIAPTIWATLAEWWWVAFACFVTAGLTDVLDGLAARSRREVTGMGKFLDPAVDKLLYMGIFFALASVGKLPLLGPILYLIPQLGLGVGALIFWKRRERFSARWPGKAAAALTAVSAILLLLTPWGQGPFWAAVGANFLAGGHYLYYVRLGSQAS